MSSLRFVFPDIKICEFGSSPWSTMHKFHQIMNVALVSFFAAKNVCAMEAALSCIGDILAWPNGQAHIELKLWRKKSRTFVVGE